MDATIFLMYHELQSAGISLCADQPGYVRYVVEESTFRLHLEMLKQSGLPGLSVSEWVDGKAAGTRRVVLTFDDGCASDLRVAAPLLREHGFNATCFLTVDFLDRPGFLSSTQARELAATGIEIGCHSMTHAFLDSVDDARLEREVAGAKFHLEQLTGTPIRSFSCPGGRFDRRLVPLATRAGFESICTSRPFANPWPMKDPMLARVAVTRSLDILRLANIVHGRSLFRLQLASTALRYAKLLMRHQAYERVRAKLLG